jgi:hypothetical protein
MAFSIKSASTALAAKAADRSASIQVREAYQIDDRFARVVAVASALATPEQVFAGFREQFAHATPIPGSFVSLARDGKNHVFEGVIGVVSERVVLNDSNREDFKAVAGNMFVDKEDSLWALKATATGEVLVRSAYGDEHAVMQQLMACASADVNDHFYSNIGLDTAQIRASVQGGDLVQYVSQASATTETGIIAFSLDNEDGTDTHTVSIVRPNGQSEVVNREMVVAVSEYEDTAEDDEDFEATASATIDYAKVSAYYARMFARRPAYFEAFMARFRAHAFF